MRTGSIDRFFLQHVSYDQFKIEKQIEQVGGGALKKRPRIRNQQCSHQVAHDRTTSSTSKLILPLP
ncbi:MAG: hypothetical protein H7244_01890 [Herminiimonas sp.]|nr:hypothetical protein [Herminiimonas sp.]